MNQSMILTFVFQFGRRIGQAYAGAGYDEVDGDIGNATSEIHSTVRTSGLV